MAKLRGWGGEISARVAVRIAAEFQQFRSGAFADAAARHKAAAGLPEV